MKSTQWHQQSAGPTVPIPTNRELTLSLIGSIIRLTIDGPQLLLRQEEITPDKLLFLLLPIVRNLGKLIDRIRHSSSVAGAADAAAGGAPSLSGRVRSPRSAGVHYQPRKMSINARNGARPNADDGDDNERPQSAPKATGGRTVWPELKKTFSRNQPSRRPEGSVGSLLLSDEDEEDTAVTFRVDSAGLRDTFALPHRQMFRQTDGNYAIRESTEKRNEDGSVQRNTRTISGPDITILTHVTSQLSELPSVMGELTK